MTAILGMSGCSNSNTSNDSNSSNSNSPADTANNVTTNSAKEESSGSGFDINAYIANYTPKTELANNGLFDYEVKINGNVLTCPISAAELEALGYRTIEPYSVTLKPNEVYNIGNRESHYYTNSDGLAGF